MGCARDIVEHCGVPRMLFSDFPLGNSAGKPNDDESQRNTLERAFRVLESAIDARTTVQSAQRWSDDPSWKRDFSRVDNLSDEAKNLRKDAFNDQKSIAKERAGQ
jgi:D-proline reductase (dithiol) PrdB